MKMASLHLLMIGICFMTACATEPTVPPHPKSVPASAVWAGGTDGGAFIECSYDSETRLNKCTAYNDHTGEIETTGTFKIAGPSRANEADKFRYSAFDGNRIYLMDGSILTKVSE